MGQFQQWPADMSRMPFMFETSQPGIFAAGDVRSGVPKRMSVAIGEGATAAVSVYKYLIALRLNGNGHTTETAPQKPSA